MTTKFKKTITAELTGFIQSQARVLSLADLNWLIIDLPALRERFAKIPSETYPHLSEQQGKLFTKRQSKEFGIFLPRNISRQLETAETVQLDLLTQTSSEGIRRRPPCVKPTNHNPRCGMSKARLL
jgi:hypothetical protein